MSAKSFLVYGGAPISLAYSGENPFISVLGSESFAVEVVPGPEDIPLSASAQEVAEIVDSCSCSIG